MIESLLRLLHSTILPSIREALADILYSRYRNEINLFMFLSTPSNLFIELLRFMPKDISPLSSERFLIDEPDEIRFSLHSRSELNGDRCRGAFVAEMFLGIEIFILKSRKT